MTPTLKSDPSFRTTNWYMTFTMYFSRDNGATETYSYAVNAEYAIQDMEPYVGVELTTPSMYTYCDSPVITPTIDYCAILTEFGVTCPVVDDLYAICLARWDSQVNSENEARQDKFSITTAGSSWDGISCDAVSCTDTRTFTGDLDLTWFKFAVGPALLCDDVHEFTSIELE